MTFRTWYHIQIHHHVVHADMLSEPLLLLSEICYARCTAKPIGTVPEAAPPPGWGPTPPARPPAVMQIVTGRPTKGTTVWLLALPLTNANVL